MMITVTYRYLIKIPLITFQQGYFHFVISNYKEEYIIPVSLSTDTSGASQLEEPAKKPCKSAVAAVTYLLLKKRIKGRTLTS